MLKTYSFPAFPYRQSEEQRKGLVRRHPVVIIGAGPVGLTAALECASRGLCAAVLDDNNTVSVGSRAVCYAKRTLEVMDRLGVGERMVSKGVSWNVGKVFFKNDLAYTFNLLPEPGHKMPAMINLQQYYLEDYLVEACGRADQIELRWKHKLVSISQQPDHAVLTVETPDGVFQMEADWVIACDGANSDTRRMVGAEFTGQAFHDRFLIADVVMQGEGAVSFPTERWFWFDPPFHPGQSVLLHKQSDNVWRIDFQLGWDANPDEEKKPEKVIPRIQAMLGPQVEFELEWVSVYQFACRRIDRLRHGRVLFAGDSAHQVSPFGARGANSGVQDIDNLIWKLQLVTSGAAQAKLIDSYHAERAYAADDNLLNSTRSTDFITPKSSTSRVLRDAVLELAQTEPFARQLVNSGRLSMPTPYGAASPLSTPDTQAFAGRLQPGSHAADAPVLDAQERPSWLLNALGHGFVLLCFGPAPLVSVTLNGASVRVVCVGRDLHDAEGLLTQRYDARPGTVYLLRPDQVVAARWRSFDEQAIRGALARCLGH